ncbi:unnamed protein product [Camellia sinensis]
MATEEKKIKHFSHKHMLEVSSWERDCRMCNQDIPDDPIYYCPIGCLFTIHKSCSSTIQQSLHHHPFHPHQSLFLSDDIHPHSLCNACGSHSVNMSAYTCFDCSFTLHVVCASLTPTTKTIQSQIQLQPTHPHPLISCDLNNNNNCKYTYTCSCCSQPFDDEGSVVHVCLECKGLLHKTCAQLPRKIDHPFHPSHPLFLLPQKPRFFGYTCGACSQYKDSFIYHCSDREFYLDIACASLSPNPAENNEFGQTRRFSHPHPLILCDNKQKFEICCYACEIPLGDSICFCAQCKVLLHESCADLPHEMKHMFHPMHALTLRYHRYGKCEACLRHSSGCFYECSQCQWYMDVRCALSKPKTMMSKIHPHPLALFNKPNYDILCTTCGQFCVTPFFGCVLCHFDLHIYCISILPPTLKCFNHVHTLTLTRSPIKDYPDEDDDAEFYCDACEERRVLAHPTYYCKDCHYVAHCHCTVSEITMKSNGKDSLRLQQVLADFLLMSVTFTPNGGQIVVAANLTKDRLGQSVQLVHLEFRITHAGGGMPEELLSQMFGGDADASEEGISLLVSRKLRMEAIVHILEEEWSEQESNRGAGQVEEPTSLTLKQFLDSFNGDENKEVQGVFDAYRRDSQGDSSDNPKDSLYLDEASTEIMKILVSKNQVTMPWENWNSTSKLIKVDDYMILENLAPILGTLFGKYGDFCGMSNLSPKAKMLYIMTVCDAVNSMLSTKVKNITKNVLLSWFHCFMLGHFAGFEIQFASGRLTRVVRSHFGLQADVSTDLTLAKLDEEIGEQRALLDSKEIIASEQDREIDKLRERIASMQLTSTKVHKEIAELHKKIKTLEEKCAISRFTEECLSDALELEGQTAGRILCSLARGVDLDHLTFDRHMINQKGLQFYVKCWDVDC